MELAAVGVAIAIFNQASKVAIFPLVSVTTSFVAEEDAKGSSRGEYQEIEIVEKQSASNNEKQELIVEKQSASDNEKQDLIPKPGIHYSPFPCTHKFDLIS